MTAGVDRAWCVTRGWRKQASDRARNTEQHSNISRKELNVGLAKVCTDALVSTLRERGKKKITVQQRSFMMSQKLIILQTTMTKKKINQQSKKICKLYRLLFHLHNSECNNCNSMTIRVKMYLYGYTSRGHHNLVQIHIEGPAVISFCRSLVWSVQNSNRPGKEAHQQSDLNKYRQIPPLEIHTHTSSW